MKNWNDYFNVNENLDGELKDKLNSDYKSIKRGLLSLIEKSVENSDKLLNVQNYMDSYINDEDVILEDFVENSDIYDFYLKYQTDVDSLLSDNEYYEKTPVELNIFSLFDYVIDGTKESVKICIKSMYDDLFEMKR